MTQRKVKRVRKRALSKMNLVLIVGLALILIPFLILGWILLSASMDTGTPILGDRYKNDLQPAISKSDINAITSKLKGLNSVEKASVELATATLRVYADVSDTASKEEVEAISNEVYAGVLSVLDVNTYFSQSENKKMYDLEIHTYNLDKNRSEDDFVYVIKTKTSAMAEPISQLVSEPLDAELAKQLRDDVEARNNPSPTEDTSEDLTLGSEEEGQETE